MGQSQSQIEKNKQRPVNPQRIHGFIFFQRYYDEVLQTKKQYAKQKYQQKLEEEAEAYFHNEFEKKIEDDDERKSLWQK